MPSAELSSLLKYYKYKTDDATSERVQRLGEEARRKTSLARVPDWAKQYVSLKATATEIKLFFGDFIPGMLQTHDYARALLSASVVGSPADVEQMATNREHRAERLRGGAPLAWVVLGEETLRRTIGRPPDPAWTAHPAGPCFRCPRVGCVHRRCRHVDRLAAQ